MATINAATFLATYLDQTGHELTPFEKENLIGRLNNLIKSKPNPTINDFAIILANANTIRSKIDIDGDVDPVDIITDAISEGVTETQVRIEDGNTVEDPTLQDILDEIEDEEAGGDDNNQGGDDNNQGGDDNQKPVDPDNGEIIVDGDTFSLTEGPDFGNKFKGTAGDDLFVALDYMDPVSGKKTTWTGNDKLDGGDGNDTFQIITEDNVTNPAGTTVTNIENMVVTAAGGSVDLDTTDFTGMENVTINALQTSSGDIAVTSANTTAVEVKAEGVSDNNITVDGANGVTVTATDAVSADKTNKGTINIGSSEAVKGDVVVKSTGQIYKADGTDNALGNITVKGGESVTITQKATSDDSRAATAESNNKTVTQGDIKVTATTDTKTVSIKQDAAQGPKNLVEASAGQNKSVSITFKDAAMGEEITVGGLTFKVTAVGGLSAKDIAAAFSNLAVFDLDLTGTNGSATGDTQGSSSYIGKGVFTGSLVDGWSSAEANGASVVFTNKVTGTPSSDLTDTDVESSDAGNTPVLNLVTAGEDSTGGQDGRMGVVAGKVTVEGNSSLESVTLENFAASSQITGENNKALESVTLKNQSNQDFTIKSAANELDLTVDIKGDIATGEPNSKIIIEKGTETLNANVVANTFNTTTLESATVRTLNLEGAGSVKGVAAGSANTLQLTTKIDASEFTGRADFTLDASRTEYIGGDATETITLVKPADVASITKDIDLGAGNDTLNLSEFGADDFAKLNAVFKGGEGDDILILSDLAAADITKNKTNADRFLAKVDGFENLLVNELTGNRDINIGLLAGYDTISVQDLAGKNLKIKDAEKTGFTLKVGAGQSSGETTLEFKGAKKDSLAEEATLVINTSDDIGSVEAKFLEQLNIVANRDNSTVEVAGEYLDTLVIDGIAGKVGNNAGVLNLDLSTEAGALESLETIDASNFEGGIIVELGNIDYKDSDNIKAITVNGGKGDDVLYASTNAAEAVGDVNIGKTVAATNTAGTDKEAQEYSYSMDRAVADADKLSITINGNSYSVTADINATHANEAAVYNALKDAIEAVEPVTVTIDNSTPATPKITIKANVAGTAFTVGGILANDNASNGGGVNVTETKTQENNEGTAQVVIVAITEAGAAGLSAGDTMSLEVAGETHTITAADDMTLKEASDALAAKIQADSTAVTTAAADSDGKNITITASEVGLDTLSFNASPTFSVVDATAGGAQADILNGGEGNDILHAGTNGASLTGGEGNDLFIINTVGNVNSLAYSTIEDFQTGDMLQLLDSDEDAVSVLEAASVQQSDELADKINSAIDSVNTGEAAWFVHLSETYIVVHNNNTNGDGNGASSFEDGTDAVILLGGVALNDGGFSFNEDFGTIQLI